jgi:hypothetical protein
VVIIVDIQHCITLRLKMENGGFVFTRDEEAWHPAVLGTFHIIKREGIRDVVIPALESFTSG